MQDILPFNVEARLSDRLEVKFTAEREGVGRCVIGRWWRPFEPKRKDLTREEMRGYLYVRDFFCQELSKRLGKEIIPVNVEEGQGMRIVEVPVGNA